MQKVVAYKTVQGDSFGSLSAKVNEAIAEGWVPSGPMVVFDGELGQAMVQFEATDTSE